MSGFACNCLAGGIHHLFSSHHLSGL